LTRNSWDTISPKDYDFAFERFGGSFAVHPRVVALVASLAKRPVRYAGLTRGGELVAAVPLWGEHVVATRLALKFYDASHLIDVGDSEVVLPVGEDARINIPFIAPMLSSLHENNISNLERDFCPYPGCETISSMVLAKGFRTGDHRHSRLTQKRRRNEVRRFEEVGGRFSPLCDFSADEIGELYIRLFEKRWGHDPEGKDFLPTVLHELKDMLCGDVLLFGDRPVAIEISYKHKAPRWIFVNGVQGGCDPEFFDYSPGAILFFHNLGHLEEEARASNKTLRYSLGWFDNDYKDWMCFETPAYRLARIGSVTDSPVATTLISPSIRSSA
jgi:hypothetical protein